jgi:hypothetical protein
MHGHTKQLAKPMKKRMSLPLLMLIAGLAITSCKDKDENQEPQDRSYQGSAANKGAPYPKPGFA